MRCGEAARPTPNSTRARNRIAALLARARRAAPAHWSASALERGAGHARGAARRAASRAPATCRWTRRFPRRAPRLHGRATRSLRRAGHPEPTLAGAHRLRRRHACCAGPSTTALARGAGDAAVRRRSGDAEAIAYVIYTSGSTGKPKGVRVPHARSSTSSASMAATARASCADDRLLAVTTLSFDIAVLELFLPLSVGAEVVLASRERARPTATRSRALLEPRRRHRDAGDARHLAPAARGGLAGRRRLQGAVRRRGAAARPGARRCSPAAASCGTCTAPPRPRSGRPAGASSIRAAASRSAGRSPTPACTCSTSSAARARRRRRRALHRRRRRRPRLPRPARADRRALRRRSVRGQPDARLYRTGDLGRWLPRRHARVPRPRRLPGQAARLPHRAGRDRGARSLSHPAVARGRGRRARGSPGDVRLVAYVVARAGGAPSTRRRCARTCGETLPEYMVPQHFVALDALPLTAERQGRPQGACRRPPSGPRRARDASSRRATRSSSASRRAIGRGAARPTRRRPRRLLRARRPLAARRAADARGSPRRSAWRCRMRALFEAPDRRASWPRRSTARRRASAAATRVPRSDARADGARAPLSLMQQRLWFLEQLSPGSTGLQHAVRASACAARSTRRRSSARSQELVRAPRVLRTSIAHATATRRCSVIHADVADACCRSRTCPRCPPRARDRRSTAPARRGAIAAAVRSARGAAVPRARCSGCADDEHVLFFMPHHIICDGWSFDLFYDELAALYGAFARREPTPLPPPRDVRRLRRLAARVADRAPSSSAQLAYWREHLAGAPDALELPTDRPRPRDRRAATARPPVHAATASARGAAARSAAHEGATPFMVLLAGVRGAAAHRYTRPARSGRRHAGRAAATGPSVES